LFVLRRVFLFIIFFRLNLMMLLLLFWLRNPVVHFMVDALLHYGYAVESKAASLLVILTQACPCPSH
jgi:hypothetical protein